MIPTPAQIEADFGRNDMDNHTLEEVRHFLHVAECERARRAELCLDIEDQEWAIGRCLAALTWRTN